MARVSSSVILITTTLLLAVSAMVSCFDAALCAGSDSTGRCSPDPYPWPTRRDQDNMLANFAEEGYFDEGNTPGCYSIGYGGDGDDYSFHVFASFTCDGAPSDECRECLKRGFDRLEDGCEARAGGTVLFENCCLRYERYNICAV